MTLRECLEFLAQDPQHYALFFGGLMLCVGAGFAIPRPERERSPWKYFYSLLVYLLCLPGMLSLSLLAYLILFSRDHLFDLNLLVYGLPLVSLGLGLFLLQQQVSFNDLPGFKRLVGLMGMLGLSFLVVFMASRLWVGLIFGGSVLQLLMLAALVFWGLRWSARRFWGEPKASTPMNSKRRPR